ncbi:NUDIX domain-containing protein [Candidatus Woesebacteria bacterium]|nr:NUDIX domain-containing protein [Candidatus Woesebacteria bacterium]
MTTNITLVDENNNVLGEMDKYKAHEHPAKLHRASSVWLINDKNEVLLQKRSVQKIVGAGWWGNAICGNVRPNETFEDCAIRRLREEIGVIYQNEAGEKLQLKPIYQFIYKAYCNSKYGEFEFDQVFVEKYNGKVELNHEEASDYCWVDFNFLINEIQKNSSIPSPKETLDFSIELLKQKTAPIKINLNNKKVLLAPWSAMMLNDDRLKSYLESINSK